MLQERLTFFSQHFSSLSAGKLAAVNVGLIALLGVLMMAMSGQVAFFLLALLMTASAGGMVALFFLNPPRQQFLAAAVQDKDVVPLLTLSPDLQLTRDNLKAHTDCWWASSLSGLKEALATARDHEALSRLLDALKYQTEASEILTIGKEAWEIHSLPEDDYALWKCYRVAAAPPSSQEEQILTSLLDARADGIFCLNEKGIILFCNTTFAQWLEYKREDLVGSPLVQFLAKPRTSDSLHPLELQGKQDFLTASSRLKTIFLEQTQIPFQEGHITCSIAHLNTPFIDQSDLNRILSMSPLPIACLDEKGVIRDSNARFREQIWSGNTPARGASFLDFVVENQREDVRQAFLDFLGGHETDGPLEIQLNDARESIVAAYLVTLAYKDHKGLFIQFNDITDQKKFETQLGQSQKMQAVGQLAGGIAHDFNNLLTAMIGFCDLLLVRSTPGDQSFTDVMQIKQNANRAANLVRQLLAFSRQQTLAPQVLDITESLAESSALLRRLIGSNIELKIKHERDLGLILVDQIQLEQVIINLAVNARDAMEGAGGEISITTQNCELEKSKRCGADIMPPGSYVLIEFSDTGTGIKPEVINRIFDPFFSTKDIGSGTGLGLSTVYGIVKQTGGFIHVKSKVGEGTTFGIYLPRHMGPDTREAPSRKPIPQDLTGSSTILLVEDEDAVRLFSTRALRGKGYTVIEATNGVEALELITQSKEKIDLVISDVMMPQMDGPTFVKKMQALGLKPKILFISGYTEDAFQDSFQGTENVQFLAKPFSLNDLAVRVKEIVGDQ